MQVQNAHHAASLSIAEQYLRAFGSLAKEGNTLLLPANVSDPAGMVGQALGIFNALSQRGPFKPGCAPSADVIFGHNTWAARAECSLCAQARGAPGPAAQLRQRPLCSPAQQRQPPGQPEQQQSGCRACILSRGLAVCTA